MSDDVRAAAQCNGPFVNRRVHLRESHRTLRDGSLGVALSQALRARLRSHRPSGTFRNRLVQLFGDTVTHLAKIPVKRQAPRSLTEYVTVIQNVSTKLTGMSALDYAKANLFVPLGINDVFWRHDPQGISIGGDELYLQPRDMAKIGYLYLRNGAWEGKRLLPAPWIDKVSHATVDMQNRWEPDLRYSNFFWALPNKHAYMATGYNGQMVIVFPDLDVVAVTTARDSHNFGEFANFIFSSVKSDTALPADAASAKLLADKIRDVSTEKPTEMSPAAKLAAAISGKVYRFPPNEINVKSLSLILIDPQPHYEIEAYARGATKSDPRFTGPIGLDGLYRKGELTRHGLAGWLEGVPRVNAVKGTWQDDHTFVIDRLVLGQGVPAEGWTLTFDGEKVNVRIKFWKEELSADGETGG